MSQAKVDARKQNKKNRKKIAAHEKRMAWLRRLIVLCIFGLIAAWAGYSAYVNHQENLPAKTAEVDYSSIMDYMTDLEKEETGQDDEKDASESADKEDDSSKTDK